ncbi:MAG: PIN domain-containing protein [Chloroflexota bacterium]
MTVLVDSSVWIDYFRGGENSERLNFLIDENQLVTNDLILTELVPFLRVRNEVKVINLLLAIQRIPLQINWSEIIAYQVSCLKSGVNGIGIPDLIIAQQAKLNDLEVYALDRHFLLLNQVLDLRLFE